MFLTCFPPSCRSLPVVGTNLNQWRHLHNPQTKTFWRFISAVCSLLSLSHVDDLDLQTTLSISIIHLCFPSPLQKHAVSPLLSLLSLLLPNFDKADISFNWNNMPVFNILDISEKHEIGRKEISLLCLLWQTKFTSSYFKSILFRISGGWFFSVIESFLTKAGQALAPTRGTGL